MKPSPLFSLLIFVTQSMASTQMLRSLYTSISDLGPSGFYAKGQPFGHAVTNDLHGNERIKETTGKKWIDGEWKTFGHRIEVYNDQMDLTLLEFENADSLGKSEKFQSEYFYNVHHVVTAWSSNKWQDTGWQVDPNSSSGITNYYLDSSENQIVIQNFWDSTGAVQSYRHIWIHHFPSLQYVTQKFIANAWQIQSQINIETDSTGRVMQNQFFDYVADTSFETITSLEDSAGLTINLLIPGVSREHWNYDADRNCTSIQKYAWIDKGWILQAFSSNLYEAGRKKRADGWEIFGQMEGGDDTIRFRYDFGGIYGVEPETTITYSQDLNRDWQYSNRIIVDSNSAQRCKTSFASQWQVNQWINTQKTEQTFDDHHREIKCQWYSNSNGSWELTSSIQKTYGKDGNLLVDEYQERIDGVLSGSRTRYTYDSLGRITERQDDRLSRGQYEPSLDIITVFANEKAGLAIQSQAKPKFPRETPYHKTALRLRQDLGYSGSRWNLFHSGEGLVNALGQFH